MFYQKVEETANFIKQKIETSPKIGIILGSGLGSLVERVNNPITIDYDKILNFPVSQLEGHAGQLVFGQLAHQEVVLMSGRFHYYEGFDMKEVTYPLFVMKLLGVEKIIITNSCGAINTDFSPGDLMIISDFINGVSTNPLRGVNDERFGVRFPDMSDPYTSSFRDIARRTGQQLNINYKEGVYAFFQGPYYESVAEIRMYDKMGADAIGMSTVPETIVANYLGFDVLGISCITNMATGLRTGKHSHQEVVAIAQQSSLKLVDWVYHILAELN